jgi:hypothetical protein
MTKPTIHLNGTHPKDLLAGYRDAYRACNEAVKALAEATPNGRDYYPQGGDAMTNALSEHAARMKSISLVADEMLALAEHVMENAPKTGCRSLEDK